MFTISESKRDPCPCGGEYRSQVCTLCGAPPAMINIMYSCDECGIHRRTVQVRARDERDVVAWMNEVLIVAISMDHEVKSPRCAARKISNVMIPVTGAGKVGGLPIQ